MNCYRDSHKHFLDANKHVISKELIRQKLRKVYNTTTTPNNNRRHSDNPLELPFPLQRDYPYRVHYVTVQDIVQFFDGEILYDN